MKFNRNLIFIFQHILSCFLVAFASNDDHVAFNYQRSNSESEVIESPDFQGEKVTHGSIFTYTFENTAGGYIRLVFSDFDIHVDNSLRISDGITGNVYVYSNSTRPVFQSTTPKLVMLYKVYTHEQFKIGWKVLVNYVSEPRSQWLNIPAIGLCPELAGPGSILQINSSRFVENSRSPYIDCVWTGDTSALRDPQLAISAPAQDVSVSVRHGNTSSGPNIGASIQEAYLNIIQLYNLPRYFYVRLTGTFSAGSIFKMMYQETDHFDANSMNEHQRDDQTKCLYKDCFALYGRHEFYGQCRMYWQTCNIDNYEPSCDPGEYTPCCDDEFPSCYQKPCYRSNTDLCDHYNDCLNGFDESKCGEESGDSFSMLRTFGVVALVFSTVVIVLIFTRNKKKPRRCDCLSNSLCNFCSDLKESCCGACCCRRARAAINTCLGNIRCTSNEEVNANTNSSHTPDSLQTSTISANSVQSNLNVAREAHSMETSQESVGISLYAQPPPPYNSVADDTSSAPPLPPTYCETVLDNAAPVPPPPSYEEAVDSTSRSNPMQIL